MSADKFRNRQALRLCSGQATPSNASSPLPSTMLGTGRTSAPSISGELIRQIFKPKRYPFFPNVGKNVCHSRSVSSLNHSLHSLFSFGKLPRSRRFFLAYKKHFRCTSGIYRYAFGGNTKSTLATLRVQWLENRGHRPRLQSRLSRRAPVYLSGPLGGPSSASGW